jgi:hypothetical protein
MDQLILAARDVVDAWENHTVELEVAIRRLAEALEADPHDERHGTHDQGRETQELTPATVA